MKKNKLILLTIMMVLVLYCGAVIFVTKPNSFAYSAIFGDSGKTIPAKTSVESSVSEAVDVDAILKQAEAVARDAAKESAESVRKAIEQSLPSLVDEAVKKAMAEYDISDQVAKKVYEDVISQKDEFAALIYNGYKDNLVDAVTKEVMAKLEAEKESEVAPVSETAETVSFEPEEKKEPEAMTAEEYEAQRQAIRESEINSLLEKLGE